MFEQLLIVLFCSLLLDLGDLKGHLGIDNFLPQLASDLAEVIDLSLQVSHVIGCLHLLELSNTLEIASLGHLLFEVLDLTGLGFTFRLKLDRNMLQ